MKLGSSFFLSHIPRKWFGKVWKGPWSSPSPVPPPARNRKNFPPSQTAPAPSNLTPILGIFKINPQNSL